MILVGRERGRGISPGDGIELAGVVPLLSEVFERCRPPTQRTSQCAIAVAVDEDHGIACHEVIWMQLATITSARELRAGEVVTFIAVLLKPCAEILAQTDRVDFGFEKPRTGPKPCCGTSGAKFKSTSMHSPEAHVAVSEKGTGASSTSPSITSQ